MRTTLYLDEDALANAMKVAAGNRRASAENESLRNIAPILVTEEPQLSRRSLSPLSGPRRCVTRPIKLCWCPQRHLFQPLGMEVALLWQA